MTDHLTYRFDDTDGLDRAVTSLTRDWFREASITHRRYYLYYRPGEITFLADDDQSDGWTLAAPASFSIGHTVAAATSWAYGILVHAACLP